MELLQHNTTGVYTIMADGTDAANPGVYTNRTDDIGSWVNKGYELSDGKIVKAQVKRIVELNAGATIDDKFNAISNDSLKLIAAKEILFDLQQATIVPSLMNLAEYEQARLRRQALSAEARNKRWNAMLVALSSPEVLADQSKIALLDDTLREYKDDYVLSDNKVFEAFIDAWDHPLNGLAGYKKNGKIDFATSPGKSLDGLSLWDLGGADADYKSLVAGIIHDCITNATQYITA